MTAQIRFTPVDEINDPLTISIGLSGGSGTGKTYSALLLARGIAERMTGKKGAPIGYVDTENRRALHYRTAFPEMVHYDMEAGETGFGPERWIEVIDAAEAAELPVVILDSFSHAWEGVGGVLDLHATVLERLTGGDDTKRAQRSQLAWAEVKPRYRRLIDRIVRAKTNIIICTRAKSVMQTKSKETGWKEVNARDTKIRRKDIPWDPASDADLIFEMTAMIILDPSAPGCPVHQIKVADQFKGLFDPRVPLSPQIGAAMADWAVGENDRQDDKELMDEARKVARNGTEAFRAFWNQDRIKASRGILRPIVDELQALAAEADAANDEDDDDPFAKTPTPEELAAAERAAKEEAEANASAGQEAA